MGERVMLPIFSMFRRGVRGELRLPAKDTNKGNPPNGATGKFEEVQPKRIVSLLSFFRKHFDILKGLQQLHHQQVDGTDDTFTDGDYGTDDDEFLDMTFSTIDDVIEFYRSDDDNDVSNDVYLEGSSGNSATIQQQCITQQDEANSYVHDSTLTDNEHDAIVTSWIDNYHFLLVEQEIRKQRKRKKKSVRFDVHEDENDNDNGSDSSCNSNSMEGQEDDDDLDDGDCSTFASSSSSYCSCTSTVSDTDSSCYSLDTIERQEFEDFANKHRGDQGMRGNFWGRLLQEVLLGPSDEDFELFDTAAPATNITTPRIIGEDGRGALFTSSNDDTNYTVAIGTAYCGSGNCSSSSSSLEHRSQHSYNTITTERVEINPKPSIVLDDFCNIDSEKLPIDLLFSVENQ